MSESKAWLVFWLIITLGFLTPEACARYEESIVKTGDIWVYCPENDNPFKSAECDTTYVIQIQGNYALCRKYGYELLSRKRYSYEFSIRKRHVASSGAFRIKKGK